MIFTRLLLFFPLLCSQTGIYTCFKRQLLVHPTFLAGVLFSIVVIPQSAKNKENYLLLRLAKTKFWFKGYLGVEACIRCVTWGSGIFFLFSSVIYTF